MVLKSGDVVTYITNPSIFGIVYITANGMIYVRYMYRDINLIHHSGTYEHALNFSRYWKKVNE